MRAIRMSWVVRGIIVGWMLFAWVSSASSQSLAEVAKKEKERRNKNDDGATKVITDRELTSGYGGLTAISRRTAGTDSGSAQNAAESGQTQGATGEGEGGGEDVDETKTREYWQNRASAVKEKIARHEEELQSDDWGEGQRFGVDPRGQNNLARRQETEQKLTAARAELQALQEEARRAGVPAGWVR